MVAESDDIVLHNSRILVVFGKVWIWREISKAALACSRDHPFEFIYIIGSSLTSGKGTPLNSAIRAVRQIINDSSIPWQPILLPCLGSHG